MHSKPRLQTHICSEHLKHFEQQCHGNRAAGNLLEMTPSGSNMHLQAGTSIHHTKISNPVHCKQPRKTSLKFSWNHRSQGAKIRFYCRCTSTTQMDSQHLKKRRVMQLPENSPKRTYYSHGMKAFQGLSSLHQVAESHLRFFWHPMFHHIQAHMSKLWYSSVSDQMQGGRKENRFARHMSHEKNKFPVENMPVKSQRLKQESQLVRPTSYQSRPCGFMFYRPPGKWRMQ